MFTIGWFFLGFFVSMVSSSLGALFALRPLHKCITSSWVERARLAYPPRVVTTANTILQPIWYIAASYSLYGFLSLEMSWMEIIGAYMGTVLVALQVERTIQNNPLSIRDFLQRLKDYVLSLLTWLTILTPLLCAFGIVLSLMPRNLDQRTIVWLGMSTVLLALGSSGVGLFIARAIGIASPAAARLQNIVNSTAARCGIRTAIAYEVRSRVANASAFPLCRRLIVTDKAMAALNDNELAAVCAHELAHINEPVGVLVLRVFGAVTYLLLIAIMRPLYGSYGPSSLIILVVVFLGTRIILQRFLRLMEKRADTFGYIHQGEEGAYARALERLYEFNLVPVVMSGKGGTHPHLYDRLIAAGISPSYSRPAPPSRLTIFIALISAAITSWILIGLLYFVLKKFSV